MSLIVDEHREYLSDPVRLEAFAAAIREVVSPGAVVVDLASGTGILGLLACEAGARRVYAIEMTGLIELARQVAAANRVADRMTFVRGLSTQVSLPEPADAIVCDQIGHFGFEAGLLEYGSDARRRFLKPGGQMVPSRVDLFVAPVESAELAAQVEFWARPTAGLDLSPARRWASNTGYPTALEARALLGPEARAASLDMATADVSPFRFDVDSIVERRGTLHGVGGWFRAQLSPSVTLSNAPTEAKRLTRRNVFFPIDRPLDVVPGDRVATHMHIIPAESLVTWTVELWRGGASVARSRYSTLHGMLLDRDDLRRTAPGFVPVLTARGLARRTVLELCDARRTLAEIERDVWARHPDLFASPASAAVFVAEVVTRYAE